MAQTSVLPRRQYEIALLVARGLSNKEIAGRLGISENTVKNHLRAAYLKLQIHNRTQFAALIWQQ